MILLPSGVTVILQSRIDSTNPVTSSTLIKIRNDACGAFSLLSGFLLYPSGVSSFERWEIRVGIRPISGVDPTKSHKGRCLLRDYMHKELSIAGYRCTHYQPGLSNPVKSVLVRWKQSYDTLHKMKLCEYRRTT